MKKKVWRVLLCLKKTDYKVPICVLAPDFKSAVRRAVLALWDKERSNYEFEADAKKSLKDPVVVKIEMLCELDA